MKIEILGVHNMDQAIMVAFSCACGQASGLWSAKVPAIGDLRHVELGSTDEVKPGVNAFRAAGHAPSLRLDGGHVVITARLLARYEEGTVLLGFADGRLEVEAQGDLFWRVNEWYTITLSDLSLHDMNL